MQTQHIGSQNPLADNPNYVKVNNLGNGAFGSVQLFLNKQRQQYVAIKFIRRREMNCQRVQTEVLNHRQLRHPHIIEFFKVFLTAEYVCIEMEYASGGNLLDYVKCARRVMEESGQPGALQEPAARWFFQQLIFGLDYCHRKGVVNRDIKLENTLLSKNQGLPPLLKICDFGYSKAANMSAPKSKVGTVAYMAPEVLNLTPSATYDGKQADIWSCAVMLYVMLFGHYPFEDLAAVAQPLQQRIKLIMSKITAVQWEVPASVPISEECRDLLSRLLVRNPAQRLTMEQIQAHPWFLHGLPPEVLTANQAYVQQEGAQHAEGAQSVEEIKQIMAQAHIPAVDVHELDEVIEQELIDEMNDED